MDPIRFAAIQYARSTGMAVEVAEERLRAILAPRLSEAEAQRIARRLAESASDLLLDMGISTAGSRRRHGR